MHYRVTLALLMVWPFILTVSKFKNLNNKFVALYLNVQAMKLTRSLMNPEFFTSGHKSPRLQKAYSAAKSARFEHGESP